MRSNLFSTRRGVRFVSAVAVAAAVALSMQDMVRAANGSFQAPPSVSVRSGAVAVVLDNGDVLIAGGYTIHQTAFAPDLISQDTAERYSPTENKWTVVAAMPTASMDHMAAALPNGNALVVGGKPLLSHLNGNTAMVFDAVTNRWSTAKPMWKPRGLGTATTLADGRVLVAGGGSSVTGVVDAEVFNPATNTWTMTGPMSEGRVSHTATRLADGRVLVTGGSTASPSTAEIYDPSTNAWTPAASLNRSRRQHSAAALADGRVLVTGGFDTSIISPANAEIYNPSTNTWSLVPMNTTRAYHTSTTLPNGQVVVAGGFRANNTGSLESAIEVFDPVTVSFAVAGTMLTPRMMHTATLVAGGRVLIAGAAGNGPGLTELFGPQSGPTVLAGADQTVNGAAGMLAPVLLDGSASFDPDGDAVTYGWREGTTLLATSPTATVGLPVGVHALTLTLTDPFGGSATDDVVITVVDGFSGSLAACQADLATATANLATATANLATATANLATANATNQQQSATIQQQAAQIGSLQQQSAADQQTIQQLTASTAALQAQLSAVAQQNVQLTAQNSQLTQQTAALTQRNTALTNGITGGVDAVQRDLRATQKKPAFVIPGAAPLDRLQTLVNGILQLKAPSKKDLYESLK